MSVEANRLAYLEALRSGRYRKGTTHSDERGRPVVDSVFDEGWCACALMFDLFNGRDYLKALGLTTKQCAFIQQELNDTDLTFAQIADRIESEVFARFN